jgi:hypothetical protein
MPPVRTVIIWLLAVVPGVLPVCALIQEGGTGIIYGSNDAFSLKAPEGWILDTESGVGQGVHAVFYPAGGSWKDASVVAYARSRPRTAEISSVQDVVNDVVAMFQREGSPDYQGKKHMNITTESGKKGEMYIFSGDEWGNNEAVVYFPEEKVFNFVVFNARQVADFDKFLESFEALAKSYIYLGPVEITP